MKHSHCVHNCAIFVIAMVGSKKPSEVNNDHTISQKRMLKQQLANYINEKIKSSVYEAHDREVNREIRTSINRKHEDRLSPLQESKFLKE